MQITPPGPWGVGGSAGPVAAGLKVVSGRVQNPDHIRCDQGGSRVKTLTLSVRLSGEQGVALQYSMSVCATVRVREVLERYMSAMVQGKEHVSTDYCTADYTASTHCHTTTVQLHGPAGLVSGVKVGNIQQGESPLSTDLDFQHSGAPRRDASGRVGANARGRLLRYCPCRRPGARSRRPNGMA